MLSTLFRHYRFNWFILNLSKFESCVELVTSATILDATLGTLLDTSFSFWQLKYWSRSHGIYHRSTLEINCTRKNKSERLFNFLKIFRQMPQLTLESYILYLLHPSIYPLTYSDFNYELRIIRESFFAILIEVNPREMDCLAACNL